MPDLSWTASLDVTNVSKALSKIDREAKELGISFDKSFKTADEAIKYFGENISSLETALVRLRKEQADIKLLPQTKERTERLKELKLEIEDVTTSLRQNKKWQTELSKAQREDLGNTQAQTSSFRGLFNTFKAGAKTTHSLTGGIKALSAAMKANPAGLVLLAVASLIKVFKGLYNSIKPLKSLVDGITDSFKKAYTAAVNFFGAETVSQHDDRIERLKKESDAINDVKEKTEDLKKANADYGKSEKQLLQERNAELKKQIDTENANQKKFSNRRVVDGNGNLIYSKDLSVEKIKQYNAEIELNETKIAAIIADEGKKANDAKQSAIERYKQQLAQQLELQKSFGERLAESIEDAEQKRTLAGINAMEDGFSKRLALLKFNYDKENKSIDKYEKEQIEAYNKAYKTNYTSLDQLPEETMSNIASVVSNRKASNEQSYANAVEKEYQTVIDKYQSFSVQMQSIRDKYAEEEKALRDNNTAESLAAIEVLKQKREEELESVYLSQREYAKKNNDVLKKAFGNTAITTRKQLEEAIGIVEKYRQILGADNEEDALKIGKALGLSEEETKNVIANGAKVAEEIQDIDDKLNDLKSKRTGLKKIADDFKNLAKSAKEGGLDFTDQLNNVLGYVNGVTSAVDSIAQKMHEIADITGDDTLEKKATAIQRVTQNINAAGSGAATGASIGGGYGAIIGAVIGGGINIISQIADAKAQEKLASAELKKEYSDIAFEISRIVNEQEKWIESTSLFGSSVKTSIEDAKASQRNFSEAANVSLEGIRKSSRNNLYELLADENYKLASDSIFTSKKTKERMRREVDKLRNEIYNYEYGYSSPQELIGNLRTKGGAKLSSREGFEGLFDANGKLNTEIAKSFYGMFSTDDMNNWFQQYVENIEMANEAEKKLNESVASLMNNYANDIADDLIEAFQSGENAGEKMFDTLSAYSKQWVKELLKKKLIDDVLSSYTDDITTAMDIEDEEKSARHLENVLENMNKSVMAYSDKVQPLLTVLSDNISGSASSSTAKGIAQASQDSVDELNGRFTAIQSHTYSINESIKDMQSRQATILNEIMGIHRDTSSIDGRLRDGISVRLLR